MFIQVDGFTPSARARKTRIKSHVTRLRLAQKPAHQRVQLWQLMKGHGRQRMVLRMVGHIPRKPTHPRVRIRGTRIFQHVRAIGTAGVFRQQVRHQRRIRTLLISQPRCMARRLRARI